MPIAAPKLTFEGFETGETVQGAKNHGGRLKTRFCAIFVQKAKGPETKKGLTCEG